MLHVASGEKSTATDLIDLVKSGKTTSISLVSKNKRYQVEETFYTGDTLIIQMSDQNGETKIVPSSVLEIDLTLPYSEVVVEDTEGESHKVISIDKSGKKVLVKV